MSPVLFFIFLPLSFFLFHELDIMKLTPYESYIWSVYEKCMTRMQFGPRSRKSRWGLLAFQVQVKPCWKPSKQISLTKTDTSMDSMDSKSVWMLWYFFFESHKAISIRTDMLCCAAHPRVSTKFWTHSKGGGGFPRQRFDKVHVALRIMDVFSDLRKMWTTCTQHGAVSKISSKKICTTDRVKKKRWPAFTRSWDLISTSTQKSPRLNIVQGFYLSKRWVVDSRKTVMTGCKPDWAVWQRLSRCRLCACPYTYPFSFVPPLCRTRSLKLGESPAMFPSASKYTSGPTCSFPDYKFKSISWNLHLLTYCIFSRKITANASEHWQMW